MINVVAVIKEELDMDITVKEYLAEKTFTHPIFTNFLIYGKIYIVRKIGGITMTNKQKFMEENKYRGFGCQAITTR